MASKTKNSKSIWLQKIRQEDRVYKYLARQQKKISDFIG